MINNTVILLSMAAFFSFKTSQDLPTADQVDLSRYEGLWYEIARLPNSFEKGLECVTATYTQKSNGKIEVLNKGFASEKGRFKTAKGTARVPDSMFPGRLKVTFFWPFSENYYIISLDENYRYALVGDPTRRYLWVLSRTKELDASIYDDLLHLAKNNGFDTSRVLKINQSCE